MLSGISPWLLGVWFMVNGCGGSRELSGVEVELPNGEALEFPAEMVTFENSRGESITGVLIYPDAPGPMPAAIMLHGAGGLFSPPDGNDTKFEVEPQFSEWAAMLTRRGHAVLFPDSFSSRGFLDWDDAPDGLDGIDRITMRVYDAYAALEFVCEEPAIDCSRVALIGFSNGGSAAALVLHEHLDAVYGMAELTPAAERSDFALSVAYYPGCGFRDLVSLSMDNPDEFYFPTTTLTVHHGTEDSLLADCQVRQEQTEALTLLRAYEQNPMELIVHDGAGHGFDGDPVNSQERAARDEARASVLELIDSRL